MKKILFSIFLLTVVLMSCVPETETEQTDPYEQDWERFIDSEIEFRVQKLACKKQADFEQDIKRDKLTEVDRYYAKKVKESYEGRYLISTGYLIDQSRALTQAYKLKEVDVDFTLLEQEVKVRRELDSCYQVLKHTTLNAITAKQKVGDLCEVNQSCLKGICDSNYGEEDRCHEIEYLNEGDVCSKNDFEICGDGFDCSNIPKDGTNDSFCVKMEEKEEWVDYSNNCLEAPLFCDSLEGINYCNLDTQKCESTDLIGLGNDCFPAHSFFTGKLCFDSLSTTYCAVEGGSSGEGIEEGICTLRKKVGESCEDSIECDRRESKGCFDNKCSALEDEGSACKWTRSSGEIDTCDHTKGLICDRIESVCVQR